jgi:hypothetical protein
MEWSNMARPALRARARSGGGGGGSNDDDDEKKKKKKDATQHEAPKDNREMFENAGKAAEAGAPVQDAELEPVGAGQTEEMAQASADGLTKDMANRAAYGEADPGSNKDESSSSNDSSNGNDGNDGGDDGQSVDQMAEATANGRLRAPARYGGGGGGGGGSNDSTKNENEDSSNADQGEEGPGFDPRPDSYDEASDVGSTEEERSSGNSSDTIGNDGPGGRAPTEDEFTSGGAPEEDLGREPGANNNAGDNVVSRDGPHGGPVTEDMLTGGMDPNTGLEDNPQEKYHLGEEHGDEQSDPMSGLEDKKDLNQNVEKAVSNLERQLQEQGVSREDYAIRREGNQLTVDYDSTAVAKSISERVLEQNPNADRGDFEVERTDNGGFAVEWGEHSGQSDAVDQLEQEVKETYPGIGTEDYSIHKTGSGELRVSISDQYRKDYAEKQVREDLKEQYPNAEITIESVSDDGTVEYTVDQSGSDRYGNNTAQNKAEAARSKVGQFGAAGEDSSEQTGDQSDQEDNGDVFSGAVSAFEDKTGVDVPGDGSVIKKSQEEISPTAGIVDATDEQLDAREQREEKYADEAAQFVDDVSSGKLPSAAETGSFIFQAGEGIQWIGQAGGQGVRDVLSFDGRGPVVGGGGNTVGTQAENAIAGVVEDTAALGGGAVQGINTIPRGVQQVARGERSATSAAGDLGDYGEQTARSQARYFANNPAEFAIDFAGGAVAAKAYASRGSLSSRAKSGVQRVKNGDVSVPRAESVRARGRDAAGTVVEAARRRPRVRVTRDADAGLLEIDEGLKQSLAEYQVGPTDLSGRARNAVASRKPSRPSRPDVDLSTPSQQQVNDMAYRAGSRSKRTQEEVRSAVEYEVSRMRNRVENAGSGPEWSLPDQQQVNDAAYRAGYHFEARKNELARNIEATKSELAGRLDASGTGRPSFPDQQQINDAAYRLGYRTEAKKQAVRSAVEYEVSRMRNRVENAGSDSGWSLPDQQQVNDMAYRSGYRFEAGKNDLAADIALAKDQFAARLGGGGSKGGLFPSQQQVNDMAYRSGYRFEARKNELASDIRYSLGQVGDGGYRPPSGQQLVSDALSGASARYNSARRLPSELTIRVEPGRPAKRNRVINADDLDISLEGSLPNDDLDTAPWMEDEAGEFGSDTDATSTDVDSSSSAGDVDVEVSQSDGTAVKMKQRSGDTGKSPEAGPMTRDAADAIDTRGGGFGGMLGGGALAALGPLNEPGSGIGGGGKPANGPAVSDVTGAGLGQSGFSGILEASGPGLRLGGDSGLGHGQTWDFDSGLGLGNGVTQSPDMRLRLAKDADTRLALGSPPTRPPTRPRKGDDDPLGPLGGSSGGWDLGGTPSAGESPLASGWVAETFTTIATRGHGPSKSASQSDLEKAASAGGWELPTYAMMHGSAETQERIAAVEDLFDGIEAPEVNEDSNGGDGI